MRKPRNLDLCGIRGIAFDLDGTLVDSRLDFEQIRGDVGCPDGIGILEYIDTLTDSEQQQAHQIVLRHERRGAENATLMPGADSLLRHLRERGLPTAILTRNARDIARHTLARLNLQVDYLLARENCAPKPHPEGLLRIARQWQLPCQDVIYVGDHLYDLQAARRAGMVACLYAPIANDNRFHHEADWIIDSLQELQLN